MFKHIHNDRDNRCKGVSPRASEMREAVAKCVLLLALALAAPASLAQDPTPDAMLRAISVKVIDKIKEGQKLQIVDPANIADLVETNIMPLFDFVHMTRLAMARNWRLATPEQQEVLADEFRTLLVRTYSTALAQYSGEVIGFKQLRGAPLATEVTVRSEVKQPGKERMILDYDMAKTAAGWKIYDVTVAGVRLVTTYRDVFAEEVRAGGVDGLIKFLADGNRGSRSRFKTIKNSFWEKSRVFYAVFQDIFRNGRQ